MPIDEFIQSLRLKFIVLGSSDYSSTFKIPKGMQLWAKLKGGLNKFGRKSEGKFDTPNSVLPPGPSTKLDTVLTNVATSPDIPHTCNKSSNELENISPKQANNVHFKNDRFASNQDLPIIQVQPISKSNLTDKAENTSEASDIASVEVHSPPCKIELSRSEECNKNADILFDTLSIDSSGQYQTIFISFIFYLI